MYLLENRFSYSFKVSLGRAARTDAGVHAAGNLVSIKMITAIPGVIDIVARINEELPAEIRVWGYVREALSFYFHDVHLPSSRSAYKIHSMPACQCIYFFETFEWIVNSPTGHAIVANTLISSQPTF